MARYTRLQEHHIQKIASKYNLTVVNFEPIEGGAANSSYLLQARQGSYVLTVFDDKSWADVIRIGRLLLLLAEYKFPTTRLLSPTGGGIATMYRGKPVLLKTYIAGQVCQDLNETILDGIGAAMARLHQVPAPDFLPNSHPYGRQVFETVIGQNINSEYEGWLAERIAYLEQHFPLELPRGLIHGDLFYDNVLVERNKFRAIIDFEEACRYYKGFDLGMGILGLCTEKTTVALDKTRRLITGYQQVRTLETREKEALQLFIEYAAIATSFWRFWKYHIHTPTAERANAHWQMARLAEKIATIPKARFWEAVFN
jgi:homoserine kinase type II